MRIWGPQRCVLELTTLKTNLMSEILFGILSCRFLYLMLDTTVRLDINGDGNIIKSSLPSDLLVVLFENSRNIVLEHME